MRCAAFTLAVSALIANSAGAQSIAPHEATYRMTIGGGADGAQAVGAGKAVVKFEKTCKAWRMRMAMNLTMAAGKQKVTASVNMAIVESLDGKTYVSRLVATAGKVREVNRTIATLTAEGGTATVTGSNGSRSVKLPKGVAFPVGHAQRSLAKVSAGEKRISALVFDQEGDGQVKLVTETYAALPAPPLDALAPALRSKTAWRVNTKAFSRQDSSSGKSKRGIDQIMLGNGVALIMRAGMGGLLLTGKLISARALKTPDCPTN